MWDRLLVATGSMSKQLGSKFLDDGYNSDSDEEGIDTHVMKVLKDYYTTQGKGIPVWLGGSGTSTSRQVVNRAFSEGENVASSFASQTQAPPLRTGKVSLKGIYEQAAERTPGQASLRRGLSRTGSAVGGDPGDFANRHGGHSQSIAATPSNSALQRTQATPLSAGERFRENLKTRRTISNANSANGSGALPDTDENSRFGGMSSQPSYSGRRRL